MASKEQNVWLSKLDREIGIRSSVIVFGNTNDILLNRFENGRYQPFMTVLASALRAKGYETLVKWDRVDGIDRTFSDKIPDSQISTSNEPAGDDYDMGFDEDDFLPAPTSDSPTYKSPDEFFPYLLQVLAGGARKTAFILDYSDYIFGNANSLSEKERDSGAHGGAWAPTIKKRGSDGDVCQGRGTGFVCLVAECESKQTALRM